VLDLASNGVRKVVEQPGPDGGPRWSPDGRTLVFSSAMGNPVFFHSNTRLAVIPAEGGKPRSITDSFDESPSFVEWNADGIYFGASQKTAVHLFRLDPASAKVMRVSQPDNAMLSGASFTRDGRSFAFVGFSPESLGEVYVTAADKFAPRRLTSSTGQVARFNLGRREVISWRSKDGADRGRADQAG
jgi:dipeptidyl aminopeptidase/acylaminoacyl peptidase